MFAVSQSVSRPARMRHTESKVEEVAVSDVAREGAVLVDAEGVIKGISPAAASALGHSVESLEGKFMLSYIHTEEVCPIMRGIAEMICNGKPAGSWSFRFRNAEGVWCWVKASAVNMLERAEFDSVVLTIEKLLELTEPAENSRAGFWSFSS